MNHTRLLHQEAVKKPKHSLVGVLTCLIFLFRIFFVFLGKGLLSTVNCLALFTRQVVFFHGPFEIPPGGQWIVAPALPYFAMAKGSGWKSVKRWWLLSMEFPGFLENLFVQLGGKVLNLNI